MKYHFIENTNRDLYMAWSRHDNNVGVMGFNMSPIIVWMIKVCEEDGATGVATFPISIDYASDIDIGYVVYNKKTGEWNVFGGPSGNGEDKLLEYFDS